MQIRIGKPSAPLWKELFLPFIQRVEHIGVQMGKLDAELVHNEDVISAQPISPLQKAQNQDKVMVAKSNLDLAFSVFQDQVGAFIDPVQTFENIVTASGDELTVIQKQDPNGTPPTTE